MRHEDDYDQAVHYAQAAMEFLAKQRIPPTPDAIAVCYGYVSERDPAVVWAIDKALKEEGKLTAERCGKIHASYIQADAEHKSLRSAADQLQDSMKQVRECIGEAERNQGAYGETLLGISSQLKGGGSAEEVDRLVRGILTETRQVMERNKALESRLAQSSQQIDALHEDLQKVRWQAMTDPLTGIANRKYFDEILRQETRKASEQDTALCLLLADIDNFRTFKALYGSKIGDEVIKLFAGLLDQLVGNENLAARYGGEEFAVIMPGIELQEGVILAERVREGVASRKIQNLKTGEHYGEIRMSFGIAKYQAGEPLERLVQRANDTLYRAKEEAQSQVAVDTQLGAAVNE